MDATSLPALLAEIAPVICAERPETVDTPLGTLAVDYRHDEEDDLPYAFLALRLPEGVFAEIDSQTYGTLHGLRIYLDM